MTCVTHQPNEYTRLPVNASPATMMTHPISPSYSWSRVERHAEGALERGGHGPNRHCFLPRMIICADVGPTAIPNGRE